MIAIRSITYNMPEHFSAVDLELVEKCSKIWDSAFDDLHTQRINFTPFARPFNVNMFKPINELCDKTNIRWFNVPVDLFESEEPLKTMKSLKDLLLCNGRAFGNIIGVKDNQIRTDFIKYYTDFIKDVGRFDVSGKDNFRVGFSVNIGFNTPFFPFTQSSGEMSFSIALEIAKDINHLCKNCKYNGLGELRSLIIENLRPQIESINDIAERISREVGVAFAGFDFSLAPSIDPNGSVITILNSIGIFNFGKTGTMFATSFITDILKYFAQEFKSVGFSGVMYSLLEDLELCRINNQRGISIEQLTMVSTMCGCGLDMVPVCGDISKNEVLSLCYEISAISCKLHKPLGIRLLPIYKCKRGSGGYTAITSDADFIANTKIVQLDTNILSIEQDEFEYYALPAYIC